MAISSEKQQQLGIEAFRAGDYEEAQVHFEAVLEMARAQGDRRKEAEALNDLGVVQKEMDALDIAFENLQTALDIYGDLEDDRGEGITLGNLGKVEEAQEKYEDAIQSYIEAAAIFEEIGETEMAMYCWQALSRLKMHQKDWVGAISAYEEGIAHLPNSSIKKKALQKLLQAPFNLMGRS